MRSAFVAAAAILTLSLAGVEARAQSFPADGAWLPLTQAGVEIRDANTDVITSGGRNVVGASPVDQPSILVGSDASYLYFRMRVDVQPTSSVATWGCEIDVDGSPGTYEYFVGYFGAASASTKVQTWFNSGRGAGLSADAVTVLATHSPATFSLVKATTVGPANWWMSWAIPRTDFNRPGFPLTSSTWLRLTSGVVSDGHVHLSTGASADLAGDGSPSDSIVCGDAGCTSSTVGVAPSAPATFRSGLLPVEPNPMRGSTTIRFGLLREEAVTLEIVDVEGRRVATLAHARTGPGAHTVAWIGLDDRGRPVPTGLYFVRLGAGRDLSQRTLVVLR